MRITAARLHRFSLPLRQEWRSAGGAIVRRGGWLLRLETDVGEIGYGECAPLPSHGTESDDAALAALQAWQLALPGQEAGTALEALAEPASFATPAARSAVEGALLDLLARSAGRSLVYCIRQCQCADTIAVNAMLGDIDHVTPDDIASACAQGYGVLKLKLGTGDPQALPPISQTLRTLCQSLAPGATLRLDANRAWSAEDARSILDKLHDLPIDAIEEPLRNPDAYILAALQSSVPFPLALDESLREFPPDVLFDRPPVRRLILKLAPLGGFLPALTLAQRAAAAGLSCVVTTGVDSACGTHAALHLSAALGNGLAHGLDTSRWLAEDTGQPPLVTGGMMQLPAQPGSGFTPHPHLDFSGIRYL